MTEALWTAQEIATATDGQFVSAFSVQGVSIDTRTVETGDLFVALAGARDGHDFIAQALEKGAAGALASRPSPGHSVQVSDTFKALEALGLAARVRAPQARRGAEHQVNITGGAFTLVDESYNAYPISMSAALASLGARSVRGRRIVALTDMLELGDEGPNYHAALVEPLSAADIDLVFCAGPLMKSLWDALPSTRRGGYALSAVDLAPQIAQVVEPGDLVMVKGSNGSKAGVVATALGALNRGPEGTR